MHPELTAPEGRALIQAFVPYDEAAALALSTRLRAHPHWGSRPAVVAAAATQSRLRTRAASRFPGRERWWTAEGLEQATRPEVARRHAQRFVAAGIPHVWDLGCGAGSDAIALAQAGIRVSAVDRDEDSLAALRATATDWGLPIETLAADVTTLPLDQGAACFVDPARRSGGKRTLDPRHWSPPWLWVTDLAGRVGAVGAKVAPGIEHALIPREAQAEWTSSDGTLVEAAVWWADLRQGDATRTATVLADGASAWLDDSGGVPETITGTIGTWLVEPAAAVIRAGLVTVLAERLGARQIDPRIAYLTMDHSPDPGLLGASFEVLDEVPFARRAMRSWLTKRGYGNVVIKKRGVGIVPEDLRAALRLSGHGPTATLVLTRTDAGPIAWAVRRPGRDEVC